jgi:Zn-finger nucleic acid-binding protein
MDLNCPKCKKVLRKLSFDAGLELETCEACKGHWLDKNELALATGTEQDFPNLAESLTNKREVPFTCPRCESVRLSRIPYFPQGPRQNSLYVDNCPQCLGNWLDARELGEIREALRSDRIRNKKID